MAEQLRQIDVRLIDPSPYQPRVRFDEVRLAELAASLREQGMIQPIVVRPVGTRYELIAGERRFRAALRLGWTEVPALLRPCSDEQALEAALIENLQREDISVVEAARAYERLVAEFGYTQGEVAQRTGKSRAAVNNLLRVLHLPEAVLDALDRGDLTEGHGRALLGLPYASLQAEVAEWVIRNAVSVRETERKVRALVERPELAAGDRSRKQVDPNVAALEERIQQHFGTRAALSYRRGTGSLTLEFYSDDDLWRILELMGIDG